MVNVESSEFTFSSVGQALIKYDLRRHNHEDFLGVIKLLKQTDVAFTNLETTIRSEIGGWATKRSLGGGSGHLVLDVLKWMGFDILSLANNHSFDLGSFGILSTIENAKKRGFAYAGTGASLEEAAAPGYLETSKGRVALIAMASGALPDNSFASSQCLDFTYPGAGPKPRPGINPLRLAANHVVKKKDLKMLRELSENIGYETMKAARRTVGWDREAEEGIFKFLFERDGGHANFVEGDDYENRRIVREEDMNRNLESIETAAEYADYVFVYLHQHHWDPDWQKTPAWAQDVAHKFIDAGATAFIGHGVPMLHGIEIYKKRPIFYSLGNFIFHSLNKRYRDPKIWESVVSTANFCDGEVTSMKFYPIALGGEKAMGSQDLKLRMAPHLVHGEYGLSIIQRLADLSKQFNTKVEIVDEHAEINLN